MILDVNEAFSQLGSFGIYQSYVYFISLFPQSIAGLIYLSTVFLSGTPDYRCFINECESKSLQNSVHFVYNSCKKFSAINTENNNFYNNCSQIRQTTESCDKFVYSKQQFESTIVTEWDIVCDNSWKLPFSQSVLMFGILFGVIVNGYLADRFGRKILFLFLPIMTLISGLSTAFAPNFIVFVISTAIMAYSVTGMSQTSYIIGLESIGSKYRVICANFTNILFAIGSLVLCLIAYYIRDWRQLQLIITLPFSFTLFYYWLFPESVRWQVSKGKLENALITIRRAAKWNGIQLNEQLFIQNSELQPNESQKYGPLDLLRHPITRVWTLNLAFIWITNSIIYFGLTFQASTLGSDLYTTFALLLALDVPLIALASITSQLIGRKRVLFLCFLSATISCISAVFITRSSFMFTLTAIFGKSSISASFAVVYIYTFEMYPTFLRSTGIGICSMTSRIGGIIAPFLIKMTIFGENFPLLFCAIFALISGILTLNLPETFGKELPENFEDIEKLKSEKTIVRNGKTYWKIPEEYENDKDFNEKTRLLTKTQNK